MIAVVVALAVGTCIFAAARLALAKPSWDSLRRRVAPHVERRQQSDEPQPLRERLAMRFERLFAVTETRLGKSRFWASLDSRVERAALPMRAVELVYLVVGVGLLLALLAAAAGGSALFVLATPVLCAGGAHLALSIKITRRRQAFEAQLADVLAAVASSLKAGHSFSQALQAIASDAEEPCAGEFKRVLAEVRLGRPMDEALNDLGARIGSRDLEFALVAITIQREVGGGLAGLFEIVADTIRERQRFTRKIKALTAMGRASAAVLIAAPFVVGVVLTAMNGHYMRPLYATSAGHLLLVGAALMMVVGATLLKKIVSFRGVA